MEIVIPIIILLIAVIYYQFKVINKLKNRYGRIIDIDSESERLSKSLSEMKANYNQKKDIFDKLSDSLKIYEERYGLIELGFYEPIFEFSTSDEYKYEINNIREEQKYMLQNKTAIFCNTEWTIDGSRSKGKSSTNKNIKLTARAFNNECDSLILKVRWNNYKKIEERIEKTYESINKLNISNGVQISKEYLDLKLKELNATYLYAEKKYQEKQEQFEIRQRIREEEKLEKEIEKAEEEEEKYQKLLNKTLNSLKKATGEKLESLQSKVKELEAKLKESQDKNKRAKSMAQQTKVGYVYVISNIGSFGDNVFKIGMTRRLEPLDRVKELGDASVPFSFDVHAMIYSNNAPELENRLHKAFNSKKLNLINNRKEFFTVSLDQIENELKNHDDIETNLIKVAEAKEYYQSLAIRNSVEESNLIEYSFPDSI
ncbi:MAG: DUF4041 domain-containing protein [Candidatus Caenarcaniphilales bacterium]|nr:DUF4041 domain-containing protein [Candidatus Caenarcaniphilales bacterium]